MDKQEVQLIVQCIKNLDDKFDSKIDDLKETVIQRVTAVEQDMKGMCLNCKNGTEFREKFKSQKLVNASFWTIIGAAWIAILTIYSYLYQAKR